MDIKQNLVSPNKYGIKCPYSMIPVGICVHNTSNDASASNEIAYMIGNNNSTSFHYAIDDKEVIQGVPENRNAFHAGDGANGIGNRKYIGIEICYSKSGGDRFIAAENNAAVFIASKLKEYGWDISHVKKHQDFSGKYCPHRTLDLGWQRFLDVIKNELDKEEEMTREEVQAMIDASKEKVYHYWDEIKKLPGDIYPAAWAMYKAGYFLGESPSDLNVSKTKLELVVIQARVLKAEGKLTY